MKTKSKCIGCHSIKIVNALSLCKRCNREAHKYISTTEMERLKLEREMMLAATKAAKKAKKEEAPKEGEAEGEEGAPEEGEEEGEEEEGEDKPKDEEGDTAKPENE